MRHTGLCLLAVLCTFALYLSTATEAGAVDNRVLLGKYLFFDTNLSHPNGQSCASCHDPSAGFADPNPDMPVSQGAIPERCGSRNSPSAAYAAYSPPLHYESCGGGGGCGMGGGGMGGGGMGGGGMGGGGMGGMMAGYVGGQFWDGRAASLEEQAKGPFLNPLEMNNPNRAYVTMAVRSSTYAGLFKQVFGNNSLKNVNAAYDYVAAAIAAYERSSEVCRYSSKYDYYTSGNTDLTSQELRGMSLFSGKAQCANCHSMQPGPQGKPLFTKYGYFNMGVPRNENNPFYWLPKELNPDGVNFVDIGLGGFLHDPRQYGKFKTPTLRNIAVTYPYMHNGVFQTLGEVVHFYNTRDVADWPPPEVNMNVFRHMRPMNGTFGRLGLTAQDEEDIVAFISTLTDGYM